MRIITKTELEYLLGHYTFNDSSDFQRYMNNHDDVIRCFALHKNLHLDDAVSEIIVELHNSNYNDFSYELVKFDETISDEFFIYALVDTYGVLGSRFKVNKLQSIKNQVNSIFNDLARMSPSTSTIKMFIELKDNMNQIIDEAIFNADNEV